MLYFVIIYIKTEGFVHIETFYLMHLMDFNKMLNLFV